MIDRICWALLGLIHVLPALALFKPALLTKMYGVEPGSDSFTLMHHRAALFLVIVVIAFWAALRPEVRQLATVAVGISMGGFVLIWWLAGASPALNSIAVADMIGLPILLFAGWQAFKVGGIVDAWYYWYCSGGSVLRRDRRTAMIRPHNLLKDFGIETKEVDARNEMRGIYGGFPLAVSALLLFSLTRPDLSNGILVALASCSAAMAAGRIVSAVIDRHLGKAPLLWATLEVIVAGLIASNISGA